MNRCAVPVRGRLALLSPCSSALSLAQGGLAKPTRVKCTSSPLHLKLIASPVTGLPCTVTQVVPCTRNPKEGSVGLSWPLLITQSMSPPGHLVYLEEGEAFLIWTKAPDGLKQPVSSHIFHCVTRRMGRLLKIYLNAVLTSHPLPPNFDADRKGQVPDR